MASITVRKLEDEVKTALRLRAAEHGNSMEEEARQILRSAVGYENIRSSRVKSSKSNSERKHSDQSNAKTVVKKTETEKWLDELEQRGVLERAKDRSRNFSPGEPCPGALNRFLAER